MEKMNEQASGATSSGLSGAGTGAAAGAAIGAMAGGVGAVPGAVIGAVIGGTIGVVGGFMSGGKAKKARKYAQKAAAIQQQREQEAYRQSLLAQIRQARISRASNLAAAVAAGTEEGSGAQATLSSIGSQISNIVEYMSVDRGRAVEQANYLSRAKKNAASAQQIQSITNGILDLGSGIAGAYAATAKANTPSQTTQQTNVTGINYGQMYGPYYQYSEQFGPKLNA